MVRHPPWLRFQAYVVGLPKTGSTSLATVFGNYRTGHEWQMPLLLNAGLQLQSGGIDDDGFWDLVTPRLSRPSLEMDSATCHHLYVDRLAQRFPASVFIHTIRDVSGWVTSTLDMAMRWRIGRELQSVEYLDAEVSYIGAMTEGNYDHRAPSDTPDADCVEPMMRFWAHHMRGVPQSLPAQRSLTVRTAELSSRLGEVADLCGVPPETLRVDLARANVAPLRFDRIAGSTSESLLRTYYEHCADIMIEHFPDEHERLLEAWGQGEAISWDEHYQRTKQWVVETIAANPGALTR